MPGVCNSVIRFDNPLERQAMAILRHVPFTGELFAGKFMEAIRGFRTGK